MIRLARFLVLQPLRRLGVTLGRPERGRISTLRLLSFYFCEYLRLGLLRIGVISIMKNMGPTQLGLVVRRVLPGWRAYNKRYYDNFN